MSEEVKPVEREIRCPRCRQVYRFYGLPKYTPDVCPECENDLEEERCYQASCEFQAEEERDYQFRKQ